MTKKTPSHSHQRTALRSRAVSHLTGPQGEARPGADPSAALGVLYRLASLPSTAPAALALLHELQVHQVEVELQDEELRHSRIELETALHRQVQLYDHAPFAYFTIDRNTVMSELNVRAASLLGTDRDSLRGCSLDAFLTPHSAQTMSTILEGLDATGSPAVAQLQLRGRNGETRRMHASAHRDPAGERFLVALMDAAAAQPASAV